MFTEHFNITASLPVSADGERVLTVKDLARRFHVSTKTVCRWRRYGLVSRRFVRDGCWRVGFLQSSVDRFVANNAGRISRGTQFSRLTDEDRHQIIERARFLAQAGARRMDVTRRIAQETGRSSETIRYTLKRFDLERPDMAIFQHLHPSLPTETKRQIFQQHCRGESAEALAHRFCQTSTSIYQIIKEARAARIMELPLDSMGNEQFAHLYSEKSDREMLLPAPETDQPTRRSRVPSGMPPYLASLYELPLLTREQEGHLFRMMNYLKYKANRLRDTLDVNRPNCRLMEKIEKLYDEAVTTKNLIIRANLRLVVSIAKRYVRRVEDFFDLVSDGNMSLMRAAEKFDVSRGNKFSTYASWAIMKNFARTIPTEVRHQDRFRNSHSEMFSITEDPRTDPYEQESGQLQRQSQVKRILDRLDEREREIVTARFGLIRGHEPLTLKQVGGAMGVSKERIRQIEARAMGKLRTAAKEDRIDFDLAMAGPASNLPLPHDPDQWGTTTGDDQ
jgi:RNA polymerase primary sigma factor/RNA polymerase sigma factor